MSILVPSRPLSIALLLSGAFCLTLSGCIESPSTFKAGNVTTADPAAGDHSNHGADPDDTSDDHSDHGSTDNTGDTTQNPTPDFISNLWVEPQKIVDLNSGTTDGTITSSSLIVDKAGNQFAQLVLSSGFDTVNQVHSSNDNSVYLKVANSNQWLEENPFADGLDVKNLQIKTDVVSDKTFALWNNLNNEVFMSSFDATTNAWLPSEQVVLSSDKNTLLISSHGMPVIVGLNVSGNILTFTYKNKMHDGTWAPDVSLSRTLATADVYDGKFSITLDSDDKPVLVWTEQNASGWEIWSATRDAANNWVEAQVLSANNAQAIDVSQIMNMGVVASTTDQGLEAVFVSHAGTAFSISKMSMDNGASFMWHSPGALITDTQATAITLKPQLLVNKSSAMMLWGEYMDMPANSAAGAGGAATITPADGHSDHQHKPSSRAMVMTNTNMLKSRSFSSGGNWGTVTNVSSASEGKLMKYVTPVLSESGSQTVSWVESDATATELFTTHNVSQVWKMKELVFSLDPQSMDMQLPLVSVDVHGEVQAVWANKMTTPGTGVSTFGLWSSSSTTAVHVAHDMSDGHHDDITNDGNNDGTDGSDTPNTNTPTVSETWGTPQTIWFDDIQVGTSRQYRGPHVYIDALGSTMIHMEKTPQFDPATNTFLSGDYLFYRLVEGSEPVQQEAIPPATATNAKMIRHAVMKSTGDIYALWSADLNLYFSRYIASVNQWLPAEPLNISNTIKPNLLVDESGMATLIWESLDSINNTKFINAKHFMPSTGWMETMTTSVELSARVMKPLVNEASVVTVPWLTIGTSTVGGVSAQANLWTADFDPSVGWSSHSQGIVIDNFTNVVSQVHNLTPNMRVATFYDQYNTKLKASVYMEGMGWGEIVDVDQNQDNGDRVLNELVVRANDNGTILIAWREAMIDSVTRLEEQHYLSSQYSMTGGWTTPQMIGDSAGYESDLDITLDATGHAIATWTATGPSSSMVHVNHYTPESGWSANPEMLASYDLLAFERAYHPSIDINLSGQAIITWDHIMLMEGNEMHHVQAVTNF